MFPTPSFNPEEPDMATLKDGTALYEVERRARYGERPISELELKVQVERLAEALRERGAHVYVPRRDFDYAINVGLRMLLLRRLVRERDGLYYAHAAELPLLRYYANSIAHLA